MRWHSLVYEPFSESKLGFTYCEILCSLPCSVLDEFQVNCDQASTVGDHVLCPVYFPHQAVQDADIIVSSQLYFVNAKFRICRKSIVNNYQKVVAYKVLWYFTMPALLPLSGRSRRKLQFFFVNAKFRICRKSVQNIYQKLVAWKVLGYFTMPGLLPSLGCSRRGHNRK